MLLSTESFKASVRLYAVLVAFAKRDKSADNHNAASDDQQLQNLLKYFGLGQYKGLIPILKKIGSVNCLSLYAIYVMQDVRL